MIKFYAIFTVFSLYLSQAVSAQLMNGQWQEHLSYNNVRKIIEAKGRIYCATDGGIFYYEKTSGLIKTISKIDGLSDVNVRTFAYDSTYDIFIIAYNNSNVDLVDQGKVHNLPAIMTKNISAKKVIKEITINNHLAYLSCGFGIVVLDYRKKEFRDTYIFGPQASFMEVNDVAFSTDSIFAATTAGLYAASLSEPNLVDYGKWKEIPYNGQAGLPVAFVENLDGGILAHFHPFLRKYKGGVWAPFRQFYNSINAVRVQNNKVYVAQYDALFVLDNTGNIVIFRTVYNNTYFFEDSQGKRWAGNYTSGLGTEGPDGAYTFLCPPGPAYNTTVFGTYSQNGVWFGSSNDNSGLWDAKGAYSFTDRRWNSINGNLDSDLGFVSNLSRIAVDPANPNHIFASSVRQGLLEIENGELKNFYTDTNSIITGRADDPADIRITGMRYDQWGNLWMVTALGVQPIYVITRDGEWKKFSYTINSSHINDVYPASNGQKWISASADGLFIYSDNHTPLDESDDEYRNINISDTEGSEIIPYANTCAEDLDGNIWVCTRSGVLVYYNSYEIFNSSGSDFPGVRPKIPRNDGTNLADYLLDGENVTAIAVDRGNRKWFGTAGSGIYLISADGTEEILHFTKENSPLISNNINDIVINHHTGEVFISTDAGIIAYQGEAVESAESMEKITVYPNPVRETYSGDVVIRGLRYGSPVKITDIHGNIVFQTVSKGGQATWNGRNFRGERVSTGVYLIYASGADGLETIAGKVLFIQ